MEVQIRSADEVLLHSSGFHCYERQDTEPNASITQPVAATLAPTNARRTAYVTIGHGEINDAQSVPPSLKSRVPERRTSVFKKRMDDLNFELKDLGNVTLATDVPADAALVLVLAPSVPLQPAEWAALERYLDKGGRIMIALDPKGETGMGSLEGKIGYKYNSTPLTDDKSYLPQRGDPSDRRFPITTKFSSHASTTSLSRSVDKGLVLIESGTFEDTPFTGQSIKDQPTKTVTIRSMDSAFLDFNSNFSFDSGTEKKQNYDVASAIEGPKLATGKHTNGWRVLLFADADLFADVVVRAKTAKSATVIVSGPLLDDSVTWLSGALP
jgi:hypothetical protein